MLSPTIRIAYCDNCEFRAVVPADNIDAGAMLCATHLADNLNHVPHLSDVYALKVTHKRKPRK